MSSLGFFRAGGLVVHASTSPTKRLPLNTDIGGDAHRRTCLIFTFAELSLTFCRLARSAVTLLSRPRLARLAPLPLEDLQDPVVLTCTCTLRKWHPRPACGTAVSSVCISISVCVCVFVQGHVFWTFWSLLVCPLCSCAASVAPLHRTTFASTSYRTSPGWTECRERVSWMYGQESNAEKAASFRCEG